MNTSVITNISVYKAIAKDAHQKMLKSIESGRRPKPDGSPGWVISLDPSQSSFKQAMIVIVFTGMWLEALMHLLIVRDHGKKIFEEYDFKSYEEKLRLIGVLDETILSRTTRFRKTRKALVHEKAHLDDGEILWAQKEADNAYELLTALQEGLS